MLRLVGDAMHLRTKTPPALAERTRRPARRVGAAVALAAALLAAAPASAGEVRPTRPAAPSDPAGFDAVLEREGEWVTLAGGARGWRPARVDEGWRPYLHGSWTFTEDGWFWVTDEPWGFATYHYGRWRFDGAYGWVWLPGREWAPAWVAWRWDGDVVGWAPLPPEGPPSLAFWTFVPARHFVGERADEHAYPAARVPALWARTRPGGPAAPAAAAGRVDPALQRDRRRG